MSSRSGASRYPLRNRATPVPLAMPVSISKNRHRHRPGGNAPVLGQAVPKEQGGEVQPSVLYSSFALSSTLPRYRMNATENRVHLEEENCEASVFDGSLTGMPETDLKAFANHLLAIKSLLPNNEEGEIPRKKKMTKRGGERNRLAEQFSGGDPFLSKQYSLNRRAYSKALLVTGVPFDIRKDSVIASTGWHGLPPTISESSRLLDLYRSGEIKEIIESKFQPVYYNLSNPQPALLIDSEGRTFGYRTTQVDWLQDNACQFYDAVSDLLHPYVNNARLALSHPSGVRGPHFSCIIGHCRQYLKVPDLTRFHKENQEAVERFYKTDVIERATKFVSSVIVTIFPGVAQRTLRTAKWHEDNHGIRPLFGLFWNLCINGMFVGQKMVSTEPHVDAKNIIGICAVLVYLIPGCRFDHTKKAWLVLWEAGIAVELPPWVAFFYPSSLFVHFNVDVDDIKFVLTNGERPTKENSSPLGGVGDEGRGSLVYYNQASMYNGPETGIDTLTAAVKMRQPSTISKAEVTQQAFPQHYKLA